MDKAAIIKSHHPHKQEFVRVMAFAVEYAKC
jgi:hypothetical protein